MLLEPEQLYFSLAQLRGFNYLPKSLNFIRKYNSSFLLCYPPPNISKGDLPVALGTADGGLIVVVIFPGTFDIDGCVELW